MAGKSSIRYVISKRKRRVNDIYKKEKKSVEIFNDHQRCELFFSLQQTGKTLPNILKMVLFSASRFHPTKYNVHVKDKFPWKPWGVVTTQKYRRLERAIHFQLV